MDKLHLFYRGVFVPLSIFVPIYYGFYKYSSLGKSLKIILLFLMVSGVINFTAISLSFRNTPDLFMAHIYAMVEFVLLSLFYVYVFGDKWRRFILFLIITFCVLCIVNLFYIQTSVQFNTYTRSLGALIIIIYSMLYFALKTTLNDIEHFSRNSLNWINAGLLIYYASSLFTFLFFNYMKSEGGILLIITHNIHDTILMLEYLLFAIGFKYASSNR